MAITTHKFTAATLLSIAAAASAGISVAALAAPAVAATATQTREVCASSVYVKKQPGVIPVGSVSKGEKVQIMRYSRSARHAQIVAPRPGFTVRGWVPVKYLCAEGRSAQFAKTSRYSVRIVNSPAGGDPGFFYVGGPANITVTDRERAGQKLEVCVTPAPEQRPSCRMGRTGRTIDTIVWSEAVATQVRIAIEGGPVLVATVYPYDTARGTTD